MENFDRYRAHPWHGLKIGDDAPAVIDAYIEITPYDAVKYEIDKQTGYLRVDSPARKLGFTADPCMASSPAPTATTGSQR